MESRSSLDLKGIVWFTLLACGLAWLVVSPLWLSGEGLRHQFALPLMAAMMLTPALSALIVTRLISRPAGDMWTATGLRLGRGRGWGWHWLFAWTVPPLLVMAAPFVGAALGLFPLDLSLSTLRALLEQAGALEALGVMPLWVLAAVQIGVGLVLAPVLNALPVFGEEWGWRGYLLPQLLPLGQWPALLISGVIWGLWHAPVILLGYNYPQHPQLGVLLMVGFCVIWGIIFGWSRLATGSVWPAVIGHGALNGMAGVTVLLAAVDQPFDTALAGITGLSGWILPLALIGALVGLGRLPVRDAVDVPAPAQLEGGASAPNPGL